MHAYLHTYIRNMHIYIHTKHTYIHTCIHLNGNHVSADDKIL